MAFIELKNVSYSYRPEDGRVLDGITFSVEKGSYTAILGHNGSGKSTLAKIICGLYLPTEGSVTVDGFDTSDEENSYEIRRRCGMVFQNPDNQLVTSIVEEDVAFAPENLGLPREEIRRRVDEALAAVGMTEFAHRATHKLSGGQKQRIAIAGMLAMGPDCIVFDEATAMLDPTGRKETAAAMKRLNKEKGITVITITHHMSEAVEADRIIIISEGRVAASGTPAEIFSQVEMMREVSLTVPQVAELFHLLEQDGHPMPRGVLHTMDAADILESYIRGAK